jgi:hypothetical protein
MKGQQHTVQWFQLKLFNTMNTFPSFVTANMAPSIFQATALKKKVRTALDYFL